MVELAEAAEEGMGQRFAVVKGVPAIDLDVAMVDGPVLRKHYADLFLVGEEVEDAVVDFGFGFDEDEGCTGSVVADAYAG